MRVLKGLQDLAHLAILFTTILIGVPFALIGFVFQFGKFGFCAGAKLCDYFIDWV
jgi:hypothetical protein